MVRILDLGLGQSRLAGYAPVNGLLGPGHLALGHESAQLPGGGRLVGRVHGQVGLGPDAEHAQSLEFLALDIHVFVGVFSAALADGQRRQVGLAFGLELQGHLVLDGQTVAVPAGHVFGSKTLHVARLDDDVLEHLVQGRAQVDVPVGVGRPVVEHVRALVSIGRGHLAIGVGLFPALELLGLVLRQVGLHGKGGLRQSQGLLVIAHFQPSLRSGLREASLSTRNKKEWGKQGEKSSVGLRAAGLAHTRSV